MQLVPKQALRWRELPPAGARSCHIREEPAFFLCLLRFPPPAVEQECEWIAADRGYIRADAVATVVEMELRRLAELLAVDEGSFTEMLVQKSNVQMGAEKKTVQGELRSAEMRLELLPKLLKNLYEDKVSGRMMEEDYAILSREYAEEREGLKKKVKAHRDRLRRIEQSEGEREQFIKAIRKFMEMRTLTNQILRELIDHIDVYEVAAPSGW